MQKYILFFCLEEDNYCGLLIGEGGVIQLLFSFFYLFITCKDKVQIAINAYQGYSHYKDNKPSLLLLLAVVNIIVLVIITLAMGAQLCPCLTVHSQHKTGHDIL